MTVPIVFAGTPEVAVPSLRAFANDPRFTVTAVLTRPDAPTGRGRKMVASPVKQEALALGLPVLESSPHDPSFIQVLHDTSARMAAVVAYGALLREPVLQALPLGWYNLHFSLLPQWRGAAPVQRAIWSGDEVTGATVFRITAGMDEGPIVAQSTVSIGAHETAGDLLDRLAVDGAPMLVEALDAVATGVADPVPQSAGAYEHARKITQEDAHIRCDVPVFAMDRQIRACTPNPGAWVWLHAQEGGEAMTLHVLRARIAQPDEPGVPADMRPGQLVTDKRHVWLGSASAMPLELLEVKAQGKKAMAAADWARGARLDSQAYCD